MFPEKSPLVPGRGMLTHLLFILISLIVQGFTIPAASQEVDGGNGHALLLDKKGQVWTVGRNDHGQLGNGTFTNSSIPIRVEGLPRIKSVSRGYDHTLAIDERGQVWSWGQNNYGQLGNTLPGDLTKPYRIKDHRDFVMVEGGHLHSVGLKADGSVWAWGHNFYGELGSGDREHRKVPVRVRKQTSDAFLNNIIDIKSVGYTTLALDQTGKVWAWGSNAFHEIDANQEPVVTAAVPLDFPLGMQAIATGWHHCVALDSLGRIWMWGSDPVGQFKESTTRVFPKPVCMEGYPKMTQIACGSWHSMAVDEAGELWAWGKNHFGMLGLSDTISKTYPVKVPGVKNACSIGAGCFQSLVIDSAGKVWTFGDNPSGQLAVRKPVGRAFAAAESLLPANGELDQQHIQRMQREKRWRQISLPNLIKVLKTNPLLTTSMLLNFVLLLLFGGRMRQRLITLR